MIIQKETKLTDQAFDLRSRIFKDTYGVDDEISSYDDTAIHLQCIHEGQVVGYYRLSFFEDSLDTHSQASELFNLTHFNKQTKGSNSMELTRACIHEDFRDGKVISMLWNKISDIIIQKEIDFAFGTTSTKVENLQHNLAYIIDEEAILTSPVYPIHNDTAIYSYYSEDYVKKQVTTLIRAYTKQGAKFSVIPAYDSEWNSWDFFSVFPAEKLLKRFKRMA